MIEMDRYILYALFALLIANLGTAVPSASPLKYVANSTITSAPGSTGYHKTGSRTSASMCPVPHQGLAPIGNGPPRPAEYETACSCNAIVSSMVTSKLITVTGMSSDGSLWSETASVKAVATPSFSPPRDCCVECIVSAKDVQIIYWPIETATAAGNSSATHNLSMTAAPTPTTPYTLVEDGMTFVSPSVYVAYRSLGAGNNCPAFGPGYFKAGDTYDTTIGYPPEALSTSMCNGPPAGFQIYTAINYTELAYPTGSQTQGTCQWRINESGTPSGPVLSIPQDISKVIPAWSSCTGAFEGSFDPPRALKKGDDMVKPTPGPDPPLAASPAASITPANPPPTSTPTSQDPGSNPHPGSASPNPGSSGSGSGSGTDPGSGSGSGGESHPGSGSGSNPGSSSGSNPGAGSESNSGSGSGANPGAGSGSSSGSGSGSGSKPDSGAGPNAGSGSGAGGSDPAKGDNPANPDNNNPGATPGAGGQAPSNPSQNTNPSSPQVGVSNGGGSPGAVPGNPPPPNSVVAAGHTIVRDPGGGVAIAGSIYTLGSTPQIAGAPLSIDSDHVVLGGSSFALTAAAAATPAPMMVGGQSIIKAPNGGVVMGSSTISSGGQTVVAGHTVSIGPSHAVVDGSTYALPPTAGAVVQQAPAQPTPSPVLVGDQSIIRGPDGGIIIGSSTLPSNAATTVAGHAISVGPSVAVVDGTTFALPTNPGATLQQAPNLAQNLATHSAINLANGAVITAGGAPAIIGGSVIAVPSGDNAIVVNGKTIPLPTAAPSSVFTVAGLAFTVAPTGFAIGSQSLSPGGSAITLSGGTTISLNPSGSLQIGSSTVSLPSPLSSVFTVGGQIFTAAPTGFALGSQTLLPGGSAITVSGTVVSLGPSGLVIGSSTAPLTSAGATQDAGLGGLIMGGLGAGGNATATGAVPFTGTGVRNGVGVGVKIIGLIPALAVGLVVFLL